MTKKNTKLWFIEPKNEEEFNEIVVHDMDDDEHLDWAGRGTVIYFFPTSSKPQRFDATGNRKYIPTGYFEITIEEFREMYGKKEECVEQVKPVYDQYAQVGDITSDKKGSGARYNNGKPDYSMLILDDLLETINPDFASENRVLYNCLREVAAFQKTHNPENLRVALMYLGDNIVKESTYVFEYGAIKYKKFNWMKGMAWSIPLACIVRHSLAVLNDGEMLDQESGRFHAAHVACNIFMLMHFTKHYLEGNDLPPKELFMSE